MNTIEIKLDKLIELSLAETEQEKNRIIDELRHILESGGLGHYRSGPEQVIDDILVELGAPNNLLGYPYLAHAILLVMEDRMYINDITFGLYPQVAAKFDTLAARVERNIRNVIEVTFARGDTNVLHRYFGNTIKSEKGKPTNAEFISRIANVAKRRIG